MLKQAFLSACAVAAMATVSGGQTTSASPNSGAAPQKVGPSMASINDAVPITADITLSVVDAGGVKQPDRQGHYYRSHDGKVREDLDFGSVITDKEAGTITTLNPKTKQAVVMDTPGPKARHVQRKPLSDTPSVKVIGQTAVEGHPVVMRSITHSSSSGLNAEVWTASDIRLPVLIKSTAQSGRITTRQYRNIQVTEPNPSLFVIPPDYAVIKRTAGDPLPSTVMQ